MKDWKSNNSIKTLAASNLSERERANEDYYATEPKAVRLLLEVEKFEGKIWECACGGGHLSEEMKRLGYEVYSTDLIDRGYGDGVFDFIGIDNKTMVHYNIITNPPYRFANEFIYRALSIMQEGKKLALFLPIRYLEGKERKTLFKKCSPKKIYVSSSQKDKYSKRNTNRYRINSSFGASRKRQYTKNEIDILVVYVHPEDAWYVIPVDNVCKIKTLSFYPHLRTGKMECFREKWDLF